MSLHRHKARLRPGPAEVILILLLGALTVFMLSGALAVPGSDWQQAEGRVLSVSRVQNANSTLGTPYRTHVDYQYTAGTQTFSDKWEGEWPSSLSPNALPAGQWERLREPGFHLTVLYDPNLPQRNSIHAMQNRFPVWWFRLSLGLCAIVSWFVFAVYPRWKMNHQASAR